MKTGLKKLVPFPESALASPLTVIPSAVRLLGSITSILSPSTVALEDDVNQEYVSDIIINMTAATNMTLISVRLVNLLFFAGAASASISALSTVGAAFSATGAAFSTAGAIFFAAAERFFAAILRLFLFFLLMLSLLYEFCALRGR